jgi:hypothetical protein
VAGHRKRKDVPSFLSGDTRNLKGRIRLRNRALTMKENKPK